MVKQKLNMDRLTKLHESGFDDASIAVKLNVPLASVRYYRNKLGLLPNRSEAKIVDIDEFHRLYKEGANDAILAKTLGLSPWSIRKLRLKYGYETQTAKRIDYARIRKLYDLGYTDLSIAKELGICSVTVGKWRKVNKLPIINIQYKHMIEARNINNIKFKEEESQNAISVAIDSESLYSDTNFLEKLMGRKIND